MAESLYGKSIRIFLSYNNLDKTITGQIKRLLELYGLDVFIAHDDISASYEFQKIIFDQIERCDIFMPLLTDNFRKSTFTDQEAGFAMAKNRTLLPIMIGNNAPHGFLAPIQAYKCELELTNYIEVACREIISIIVSHEKFKTSMRTIMIDSLAKSDSYEQSNLIALELDKLKPFSEPEINKIVYAIIHNSQVYSSHAFKNHIYGWIKESSDYISEEFKSNPVFVVRIKL